MLLYLVQHGASRLEAEDPQRPLNEDGVRVVGRVAAHLARLHIPLDAIEHSDKLRARQTAEILNSQIRPGRDARQVSGLAPNDDPALTAARLQNEACNLMLVGHLPHLSRWPPPCSACRPIDLRSAFRWQDAFAWNAMPTESGPFAGCSYLNCSPRA